MQIRFTKMQGAGNDFVVLDETQAAWALTAAHYRWLADATLARAHQILTTVRRPTADAAAEGHRLLNT